MAGERRQAFEESLTWSEANDLRIIVSDHRRDLHAQLLLAREEGNPSRGGLSARHDDAVRLDGKVMALFQRVSDGR